MRAFRWAVLVMMGGGRFVGQHKGGGGARPARGGGRPGGGEGLGQGAQRF